MQHRLPSQSFNKPNENVRAMTLRSEKVMKESKETGEIEQEIIHELELN